MSEANLKEEVWPVRLTLRETKVKADEGQWIFTTATGHGYSKKEYVRSDIADLLCEALHDILTRPTDPSARERVRAAISRYSGEVKPVDNRHDFVPHKKFPWFCAHCGYAPHEPLKHFQGTRP